MATEYFNFDGKINWTKHTTPDQWGNWTTNLYPNAPDELDRFKHLKEEKGLKNEIRKDDDGYFVILRRPQQKMMRGKVVGFDPPEIIDHEGKPFGTEIIGNGSEANVKIELYSYTPPQRKLTEFAIRWSGAKINKLVKYENKYSETTKSTERF